MWCPISEASIVAKSSFDGPGSSGKKISPTSILTNQYEHRGKTHLNGPSFFVKEGVGSQQLSYHHVSDLQVPIQSRSWKTSCVLLRFLLEVEQVARVLFVVALLVEVLVLVLVVLDCVSVVFKPLGVDSVQPILI